jgi:hypothetical protein
MIDETEDDVERLLAAAAPRKAPVELRGAVIAAVAAELDARHGTHQPAWQTWLGRAVAASLLFSVAMFVSVSWWEARRMARWDARAIVRSDVADLTAAVASVTDEKSARGVERYLLSQLPSAARPAATAMRLDLQEIQRWAEGGPLVERNESDDKNQERI